MTERAKHYAPEPNTTRFKYMTQPLASSLSPMWARRDMRGVLLTLGDFSSPLARLTRTAPGVAHHGLAGASAQVLDRLHVEPTAFCRLDSEVMVIGLHCDSAIQGAFAAMYAFRRIPTLLRLSGLDDETAELSSWDRAERLPVEKPADGDAVHVSGTCSCGMAHSTGVYNEEAFHYLLVVEYKRFERARRPFVLALIEEAAVVPELSQIRPAISKKVFAALAHSLRETDVIGWYREGRAIGALLTHLGDPPVGEVSRLMSEKIARALHEELSDRDADRLTVKIYQPYEESWS